MDASRKELRNNKTRNHAPIKPQPQPQPKSFDLPSLWNQSSSSAAEPKKTPLRAHPNVMEFANKPSIAGCCSRATEIRPIDLLPIDMPEEHFAKVQFLGSEYWIAADHDGNLESFGGEYVVVKGDVGQVDTSISGDGKEWEKHSS